MSPVKWLCMVLIGLGAYTVAWVYYYQDDLPRAIFWLLLSTVAQISRQHMDSSASNANRFSRLDNRLDLLEDRLAGMISFPDTTRVNSRPPDPPPTGPGA